MDHGSLGTGNITRCCRWSVVGIPLLRLASRLPTDRITAQTTLSTARARGLHLPLASQALEIQRRTIDRRKSALVKPNRLVPQSPDVEERYQQHKNPQQNSDDAYAHRT